MAQTDKKKSKKIYKIFKTKYSKDF